MFSKEEIKRYSRHFILPEFGEHSQQKLKAAKVLCVGAGGLGSPAATYLAASGVGTLGIIDFDNVDLSNLQRQILHSTADIGRPKVESAKSRINAINPNVEVITYNTNLDKSNILEIFANYDVILDGTDNYITRYLINDACVLLKKPNISASVFRFEGQVSIFGATGGPCYRCFYPEPPPPGLVPACGEGGVLGVVPGIVGTLQAMETIKWICKLGEPLVGRLLRLDALSMEFRTLKIRHRKDCAICGDNPSIKELDIYEVLCKIPAINTSIAEISVQETKARLDNNEKLILLDVRDPKEREINKIEGSHFIPLSQIATRTSELEKDKEIIIYCKAGKRSLMAADILQKAGFKNLKSLRGGIISWAEEIDLTMSKY